MKNTRRERCGAKGREVVQIGITLMALTLLAYMATIISIDKRGKGG
jgi:hypothetical protein